MFKILNWVTRSHLTLITEFFPGTRKMERKEKPLKKSCQNPVEYSRFNSRSGVWTSDTGCVTGFSPRIFLAHEMCAYLLAKTVPALSKWPEKRLDSSLLLKLYCVMLHRILTRYLQSFSFLSIFRVPGKTSVIRVAITLAINPQYYLKQINII